MKVLSVLWSDEFSTFLGTSFTKRAKTPTNLCHNFAGTREMRCNLKIFCVDRLKKYAKIILERNFPVSFLPISGSCANFTPRDPFSNIFCVPLPSLLTLYFGLTRAMDMTPSYDMVNIIFTRLFTAFITVIYT